MQITDQMLAHEQIYVPHAKLGTIIIRGNVQNVHMSMIIVHLTAVIGLPKHLHPQEICFDTGYLKGRSTPGAPQAVFQ